VEVAPQIIVEVAGLARFLWRWRDSNPRPSISARRHLRAHPAI